MSYNSRQSNAFRSSQNAATKTPGTVKNKQRQQEQETENYILSADAEIVNCIIDIGVPFQLEDLLKPTPAKTQIVFERFADMLMGLRKETVDPILHAASEQIEFPETQAETRHIMAFYRSLCQLLQECGIDDFSFGDLLKPESSRLKRIFSYLINFARFREERGDIINEHFQKAQRAKERIEQLYYENEDLAQKLDSLRAQREREQPVIKKAIAVNQALTDDLRAMGRQQTALTNTLDKLKQERSALKQNFKDHQCLKEITTRECNKIRPYIVDSPEKLHAVINDMATVLSTEKASLDSVERKNRALQTSSDSFAVVETDVTGCIKVMEECEAELVKEEENAKKAARHHEILTQKQTEVRSLERKETVVTRQLNHTNERITHIRQQADSKSGAAQKKMEELREVYGQLAIDRNERSKEMEKKKLRIEQTEKKMADMKEAIEAEVNAAHMEFAKLNAHISLYISEMEQCI